MSLHVFVAIQIAELPPPPIPGGAASDDIWWRIVGIILVSLITVALFLFIFRPLTPTPAEGMNEQREDEELARLAAQLATDVDERAPGVVPFRPRAPAVEASPGTEASAARERLQRMLGQFGHVEPVEPPERRRLGSRGTESGEVPKGLELPDKETTSIASAQGSGKQTKRDRDIGEIGELVTTSQDDIWGDLGEIAHRLPSEADRELIDAEARELEADLLEELANRGPSDSDQAEPPALTESAEPSVIAGQAPTEHDLNRLVTGPLGSGKIVPFVRKSTRRDEAPEAGPQPDIDEGYRLLEEVGPPPTPAPVSPITVDAQTREAIEAVIRQLLFCANVGEVLQGFGLYTDEHLRRFMADSGMPEPEFQALFAAVPPKRPEDWTRIEFISRVVRMQDGRISADVQYVDGHQPNGIERLTFVRDPETKRWLIDDIQAI